MLFDAHCHPTDFPEKLENLASLDATMCIMTTRFDDLDLVRSTAVKYPNTIPSFGLHPWYTHLVSFGGSKQEHYTEIFGSISPEELDLLPDPIPWSEHLERIRNALIEFPQALVGEIGLDKAAWVRINGEFTKLKTSMDHQRRVFVSQLELAAQLDRSASVHGVQCHQPLLDDCTAVAKKYPKSGLQICLHSYAGTPEFASQRWIKLKVPVYFSFAVLLNASNEEKAIKIMKAVPAKCLLTESDFPIAGDKMFNLLQESAEVLEKAGVSSEQIEENFWRFVGGRKNVEAEHKA